MAQKSRYAARPITNGSSGGVAQAATQEFKRIEQFLNDKTFPMPGMDNAYNAAAFPGTTDEAKITRMVAQAAADGVTVGWIPKSMLPYDPALVTYNTAVHLLREGGPGIDVYDPRAYGAAGDAVQDDYLALQACLDAAAAGAEAGGIRQVYLPGGRYSHSQPLWLTGHGTQLIGDYQGFSSFLVGKYAGASNLNPTYYGGPIILVGASTATVANLVTSLVTGSGYAFDGVAHNQYFNLRDSATIDALHGASAACVEGFFTTTFVADNAPLATSFGGSWQSGEANVSGFGLWNASGRAQFKITTSVTGVVSVIDPASTLSDGSVHHVAGTYEGTTARLFVDGTLVASSAVTGTIVLDTTEEFYVGPTQLAVPEQNGNANACQSANDSIRVSNVVRYTVGFTAPTAKFAVDANTLGLLNFDLQRGPMTRMETKSGNVWLVQRVCTTPGTLFGFGVRGIEFDSTAGGAGRSAAGLYLNGDVEHWNVEHCNFEGTRIAINAMAGNHFQWRIANCYLGSTANTRYGIAFGNNAGLGHMDTVWDSGATIPIVMGVGTVTLTNVFLNSGGRMRAGFFLGNQNQSNAPIVMNSCVVNTESGAASDFRASIFVAGGLSICGVQANGCVFENSGTAPHVIVSNAVQSARFAGCLFRQTGTSTTIMTYHGTPGAGSQPVVFDGCFQSGTWIPWSDTAGMASVAKMGKGIAITFSATPTFDASLRDSFEITLTANVTSLTMSNMTPGQRIGLHFIQDSTGGRTVAQPSTIKGVLVIDTRASAITTHWGEVGLDGNLYLEQDDRLTIPGFYQDNVAASQTDVELTNAVGRWQATRPGCLTGIVVHASEARTAGTLTVKVFKNTGLAGAAGSQLGTLTAVLDATNTSRKTTVQDTNADTFTSADELYATVSTDAGWLPVTSDIRVTLEVAI